MVTHLVLDIGRDKQFSASAIVIEHCIQAAVYGEEHLAENFELKKARGALQVYNAIVEAESILHVMGHASADGKILSNRRQFFGQREFDIADLVDYLIEANEGIQPDLIYLDACSTGSETWLDKIESILMPRHRILVIATNKDVPFGIADYFSQTFYLSLLSKPYPASRAKRRERITQAFNFADHATVQASHQNSYFKLVELRGYDSPDND